MSLPTLFTNMFLHQRTVGKPLNHTRSVYLVRDFILKSKILSHKLTSQAPALHIDLMWDIICSECYRSSSASNTTSLETRVWKIQLNSCSHKGFQNWNVLDKKMALFCCCAQWFWGCWFTQKKTLPKTSHIIREISMKIAIFKGDKMDNRRNSLPKCKKNMGTFLFCYLTCNFNCQVSILAKNLVIFVLGLVVW